MLSDDFYEVAESLLTEFGSDGTINTAPTINVLTGEADNDSTPTNVKYVIDEVSYKDVFINNKIDSSHSIILFQSPVEPTVAFTFTDAYNKTYVFVEVRRVELQAHTILYEGVIK